MVSVDLFSRWPSIRRRSNAPTVAVDPARSTTLDGVLGQQKARKADLGRMGLLLSQLVEVIEGRDLASIFGFNTTPSPSYGRLVGLNLSGNQFNSFLDGFVAAVTELGLTGPVPAARAGRYESSADDRCRASLPSAMGVAVRIRKDTPRSVARFDEFAAFTANEPSLAAAIDAGMGDGLPPGLVDVTSALLGSIAAAVRVNDTDAIRRIGTDFGALASALHQATRGGGEGAERSTRRGMVLVQKAPSDTSRARITEVEIDGEHFVIDPKTGKSIRKRGPKLKRA